MCFTSLCFTSLCFTSLCFSLCLTLCFILFCFQDSRLANGSHVLLIGLADGRYLYELLQHRYHPFGEFNNDVKYPQFYSYLTCLQVFKHKTYSPHSNKFICFKHILFIRWIGLDRATVPYQSSPSIMWRYSSIFVRET